MPISHKGRLTLGSRGARTDPSGREKIVRLDGRSIGRIRCVDGVWFARVFPSHVELRAPSGFRALLLVVKHYIAWIGYSSFGRL